jgi:hypothetical protein
MPILPIRQVGKDAPFPARATMVTKNCKKQLITLYMYIRSEAWQMCTYVDNYRSEKGVKSVYCPSTIWMLKKTNFHTSTRSM